MVYICICICRYIIICHSGVTERRDSDGDKGSIPMYVRMRKMNHLRMRVACTQLYDAKFCAEFWTWDFDDTNGEIEEKFLFIIMLFVNN
jgi:hypothetical protein